VCGGGQQATARLACLILATLSRLLAGTTVPLAVLADEKESPPVVEASDPQEPAEPQPAKAKKPKTKKKKKRALTDEQALAAVPAKEFAVKVRCVSCCWFVVVFSELVGFVHLCFVCAVQKEESQGDRRWPRATHCG
jgi:hypothetical protein